SPIAQTAASAEYTCAALRDWLRLEHADLDEESREVVDAPLFHDEAAGHRHQARDLHVDPAARRRDAEELARVRSRELRHFDDAIAVDQDLVAPVAEVGEGREPQAVHALDLGASFEDASRRADDDAVGRVKSSKGCDVAPLPRLMAPLHERENLVP